MKTPIDKVMREIGLTLPSSSDNIHYREQDKLWQGIRKQLTFIKRFLPSDALRTEAMAENLDKAAMFSRSMAHKCSRLAKSIKEHP